MRPTDRYQGKSDGGSGEGGKDDQYSVFAEIVRKYIMDGAPDEVNLRYVHIYILYVHRTLHTHAFQGGGWTYFASLDALVSTTCFIARNISSASFLCHTEPARKPRLVHKITYPKPPPKKSGIN